MVVVGVILFVTAVSVITLGGGALQSFFNWAGQTQQSSNIDAQVQQACNDLVDEINRNYCDIYVAEGDCADYQVRPDSSHDVTATEEGCEWTNHGDYSDWNVEVEGREFNCEEEGYVVPTKACPAERVTQ